MHFFQYSLQTDMARRQLEYEARQLREMMQERLGQAEDMAARHETRMRRLVIMEREMQQLQQRRNQGGNKVCRNWVGDGGQEGVG